MGGPQTGSKALRGSITRRAQGPLDKGTPSRREARVQTLTAQHRPLRVSEVHKSEDREVLVAHGVLKLSSGITEQLRYVLRVWHRESRHPPFSFLSNSGNHLLEKRTCRRTRLQSGPPSRPKTPSSEESTCSYRSVPTFAARFVCFIPPKHERQRGLVMRELPGAFPGPSLSPQASHASRCRGINWSGPWHPRYFGLSLFLPQSSVYLKSLPSSEQPLISDTLQSINTDCK